MTKLWTYARLQGLNYYVRQTTGWAVALAQLLKGCRVTSSHGLVKILIDIIAKISPMGHGLIDPNIGVHGQHSLLLQWHRFHAKWAAASNASVFFFQSKQVVQGIIMAKWCKAMAFKVYLFCDNWYWSDW